MSFPNTVDATLGGAEQPGRFATFYRGTDRYQVQFSFDPSESQLIVKKSTDLGLTWSSVDAANGPLVVVNDFVPYSVVQVDADTLKIVYIGDPVGLTVTTFAMNTDGWSGVDTPAPPPPSSPASAEDNIPLPQISTGFRVVDNSILVTIVGDFLTLEDVPHSLCVTSIYDVAGDTWTAWVTMGVSDYGDPTTFDMVPCGIAVAASGVATVFMQQVARAGPGSPQNAVFTGSGDFVAPLDAPTAATVECYGPGGGGAGAVTAGGGGGGGGYSSGPVVIAPGGTFPVTVGTGGAVNAPGSGPSEFEGVTAGPGSAGIDGGGGGAGGSGDFAGGSGGAVGTDTGGGGGASGGPSGIGANGGDGETVGVLGGPGGAPDSFAIFPNGGGSGGNRGGANPPNEGSPGGFAAGGGGDGSDSAINLGTGGDGGVVIAWVSVRNTHNCRLFQQAVLADNSLGPLHEIPQGAYPSRARGAVPVPITFDCAAQGSAVWVAFTGATSTSGKNQVGVGKGTSANPVVFSFQDFPSGNGGNGVDASPALALGPGGRAYCAYMAAPSGGPLSFLYRTDFGGGFGAAVLIGALTLPDVREFGRLQASVGVTLPEITFGTPTAGLLDLPGQPT